MASRGACLGGRNAPANVFGGPEVALDGSGAAAIRIGGSRTVFVALPGGTSPGTVSCAAAAPLGTAASIAATRRPAILAVEGSLAVPTSLAFPTGCSSTEATS